MRGARQPGSRQGLPARAIWSRSIRLEGAGRSPRAGGCGRVTTTARSSSMASIMRHQRRGHPRWSARSISVWPGKGRPAARSASLSIGAVTRRRLRRRGPGPVRRGCRRRRRRRARIDLAPIECGQRPAGSPRRRTAPAQCAGAAAAAQHRAAPSISGPRGSRSRPGATAAARAHATRGTTARCSPRRMARRRPARAIGLGAGLQRPVPAGIGPSSRTRRPAHPSGAMCWAASPIIPRACVAQALAPVPRQHGDHRGWRLLVRRWRRCAPERLRARSPRPGGGASPSSSRARCRPSRAAAGSPRRQPVRATARRAARRLRSSASPPAKRLPSGPTRARRIPVPFLFRPRPPCPPGAAGRPGLGRDRVDRQATC